jgi:hypothetical protein
MLRAQACAHEGVRLELVEREVLALSKLFM